MFREESCIARDVAIDACSASKNKDGFNSPRIASRCVLSYCIPSASEIQKVSRTAKAHNTAVFFLH